MTEPVRELVWKKQKNMNLIPDINEYEAYVLKLESVLTDGTKWSTEIPFQAGLYKKHYLFFRSHD